MTDVEAGTTKDGKVITTGYGAAPASVEAIPGNTPEKKTQSWATSAAYIFGFLVLGIGGMLLYDHFMVDTEAPAAPPVVAHHVAPPAGPVKATGNIMEDIANGVTNGIFENPTHEEMSGVEVKVDTGDVDENGDIVYADAEGHRDDESGYPNPDPFENTPGRR